MVTFSVHCLAGLYGDDLARQLSVVAVNPLGLPTASTNQQRPWGLAPAYQRHRSAQPRPVLHAGGPAVPRGADRATAVPLAVGRQSAATPLSTGS